MKVSTVTAWLLSMVALATASHASAQDASIEAPTGLEKNELVDQWKLQADLPDTASTDQRDRCVFYHQRGMANARLGRYEKAIADLKQALALHRPNFAEKGEWCTRWRMQDDLQVVYQLSGDQFGKIAHLQEMATEWQTKNIRRYFLTQLLLIDPYIALGRLKEADEIIHRIADQLPNIQNSEGWKVAQFNFNDLYARYAAYLQELHGNYAASEQLRRTALANAIRWEQAVRDQRDLDTSVLRVAKDNIPSAMRGLANLLSNQGKLGEAEYLASESLRQTLSQNAFNTTSTSNALSSLASIKLQQGKIGEASRYAEQALLALERSGIAPYATTLSFRRSDLGLIRIVQGRWQEALGLFEARAQGLRSNPEQLKKHGVTSMDWALALLKAGQVDKAVRMLQGLLDFNAKKPFADPLYIANLHGYLGAALAQKGDFKLAQAHFQQALPTQLEQAQVAAGGEEAGFVRLYRLRTILEAYLELLARLQQEEPSGKDWGAEAFKIADVARSSSVQRAVIASAARAELPDLKLAELARRAQDASNQIQALNKLLLAASAELQRSDQAIAALQHNLSELTVEQGKLRKEIALRYPSYADLVNPQPPAPADIQRRLRPDEALVSIYCGERLTHVWTVTPTRSSWRTITLSRDEISRAVARLRQGLDLGQEQLKPFDTATAFQLYASLLAPDAGLWNHAKLLDIIPHGPLGELPFAVLLTAPGKEGMARNGASYAALPWLIDKVAIAQQPSASSFVTLRSTPSAQGVRKPFIGFGDPLFVARTEPASKRSIPVRRLNVPIAKDVLQPLIEQAELSTQPVTQAEFSGLPTLAQAFSLLPPLPDTADELKEIALTLGADQEQDLYLGARASKANIRRIDLTRYRVIDFATHGLKAGELAGLDQPALALANPALTHEAGDDGFLKLDDVLGLKLNADWVVLSACNTASADGSGSEAVSGLGRGFFCAGARSVLVSNWAVDSDSARLLTTGIFRQQQNHPAMSRAEALRQAMLALRKTHPGEYGHPAYWAPFSLVGDNK